MDVSKIKTIKDVRNVLDSIRFVGYYDPDDPNDENYYLSEYFTIPQEPQGLTFSTPRRSIEEIQQEFDEKIDAQIEKFKLCSGWSRQNAEERYNRKFDKIIEKFEYAKEHGQFPPELKLAYTTSGLTAYTGPYPETSFVIKQGNNHKGYYTIGNQRYLRYYMPDKPNRLVRFLMKTCLGFVWVDEAL